MTLDPLLLSRLQWVWVISWHILLPAFTVGLASYIAVLEGLAFFTGKTVWQRISAFWTRIFAVSFGMGVVSGIVMPFQIGTNWSRFSDTTANVLAPLLAYEGLTAFFLEASFLGVLLFGRKLVPPWLHFFSGLMVAAGTLFSTFWILSVNSWMQTPQGFHVADGRFFPDDWWAIIFNPSFPYRYLHNVTAFYITTGFVVLGVAAWLMRRGRSIDEAGIMARMALNMLIVLVPLQMVLGDLHGANTLAHQPAKFAAIEGRYDTVKPLPLTLFGIPDDITGQMRYAVEIPALGSLLLTHSTNGHDPRPGQLSARPAPAGGAALLRLPHHGRHRAHHAVRGRDGAGVAPRRPVLPDGLVPAALPMGGAARLRCGDCRLDDNGGRAAALDRVWPDAYGAIRNTVSDRHGRRHLPVALHPGPI